MSIRFNTTDAPNVIAGELRAKYSASGDRILRYYIDFRQIRLGVHKELSAPDLPILQNKIHALMDTWDRKVEAAIAKELVASGKESAEDLTADAERKLALLDRILAHTLTVNDAIDWNKLRDFSEFPEPIPAPTFPPRPKHVEPEITFWDKLFRRAKTKIEHAEIVNGQRLAAWQEQFRRVEQLKESQVAAWQAAKEDFEWNQSAYNADIDALEADLADAVRPGWANAVIEHANLVLESSEYFDLFETSFEIEFDPENRLLLVGYELPSYDAMPTTKAVRFVASTGELKETKISERDQKKNFDSVCYQIFLRTIHEIFEADVYRNIEKVLFNGYSENVDRTTGMNVRGCLLSISVARAEFELLNLAEVDPKACFKALKGISASSLAALAPIAPIMELSREDQRFVDERAVVGELDTSTNLAAMHWEEFEHLVREVFAREFESRNGEVKVTRSSRDGGVDAIAFDPDPITGGKIVIQAKRYTNTVGVAAVRDLYGTVQNERAAKGILVTTSDFGPDAHEFASDKPLTLFSGANLLHLLGKHGHQAKIDIRAAREELNLSRR